MFFGTKESVQIMDCRLDITESPNIKEAKLVYIHGKGTLKKQWMLKPDSYYGSRMESQILLNGIPLIQINSPGCPTCSSILTTGYGIENVNCSDLQAIQERINAPFTSLEASIADMEPLLKLLESGLYVIADAVCYPTDGNGNFFWNVPNQSVENPATAGVLVADADYAYVSGSPIYLYPTQNTDCYDESRVHYYKKQFEKERNSSRAIVFHVQEFLGFVLDGHHKACAAALTGKPVNCVVIIPCSGFAYRQINGKPEPDRLFFSSIQIPLTDLPQKYWPDRNEMQKEEAAFHIEEGRIIHREWEKEYIMSVKNYPALMEYAEIMAAELPVDSIIDDKVIEDFLMHPTLENQQKLKTVLYVMKIQNDSRLKSTAMSCARTCGNIVYEAYKILADIKNDPEIEQFFIDYLVECEDSHDKILPIVHSYWEKE